MIPLSVMSVKNSVQHVLFHEYKNFFMNFRSGLFLAQIYSSGSEKSRSNRKIKWQKWIVSFKKQQ